MVRLASGAGWLLTSALVPYPLRWRCPRVPTRGVFQRPRGVIGGGSTPPLEGGWRGVGRALAIAEHIARDRHSSCLVLSARSILSIRSTLTNPSDVIRSLTIPSGQVVGDRRDMGAPVGLRLVLEHLGDAAPEVVAIREVERRHRLGDLRLQPCLA